MLLDWSIWLRENGSNAEFMSKLLGSLAPEEETLAAGPLVRLSVNDARDIPSIRTRYAPAVPILHASSGVRRVVGLAYPEGVEFVDPSLGQHARRFLSRPRTSSWVSIGQPMTADEVVRDEEAVRARVQELVNLSRKVAKGESR